jgi:hypothetical protein
MLEVLSNRTRSQYCRFLFNVEPDKEVQLDETFTQLHIDTHIDRNHITLDLKLIHLTGA